MEELDLEAVLLDLLDLEVADLADLEELDFDELEELDLEDEALDFDELVVFFEDFEEDDESDFDVIFLDLEDLSRSFSIAGISLGGFVCLPDLEDFFESLDEADVLPWLSSEDAIPGRNRDDAQKSMSANIRVCRQWRFTGYARWMQNIKNRHGVYRAAI